MEWVIIALMLLLSGGGFTGGYFAGKNKCNKETREIIERTQIQYDSIQSSLAVSRIMLDSLQGLPAKVDTVQVVVTRTEHKIDTIVLLSVDMLRGIKEIKDDTDTIKGLLRSSP